MLERTFPKLAGSNYRISSPENINNNCLAWALGDTNRWWEKGRGSYWPDNQIPDDTVEGWRGLFEMSGYIAVEGKEYEPGFERVAIYAKGDEPTHAARQLSSGQWTSKLGESNDIEHETLELLEGEEYGAVVQILKRSREDWSTPS